MSKARTRKSRKSPVIPSASASLTPDVIRCYKVDGPKCPMVTKVVTTLSEYVAAFSSVVRAGEIFWFRGHSDYKWKTVPSALRYKEEPKRVKALGLVGEFKRFAEFKLPKPPQLTDEFKWWQVAQHYGLPTRLLDWTQSAAVALYFACLDETADGLVLVINPSDLNLAAKRQRRVFDANLDADIIKTYLALDASEHRTGRKTIAIHPTWNSERITMQQGAFTLHGSASFELTQSEVSSMCYLPILGAHKLNLLLELERMGIAEMSIFPEPEHICSYLKRHSNLH